MTLVYYEERTSTRPSSVISLAALIQKSIEVHGRNANKLMTGDSVRPVFPITCSAASVGLCSKHAEWHQTGFSCFFSSWSSAGSCLPNPAFFLRGNRHVTPRVRPLQFSPYCKMLAKCVCGYFGFSVWLCFFMTLCGVTLFICCFHVKSQAHRADFIIPGVDLRSVLSDSEWLKTSKWVFTR